MVYDPGALSAALAEAVGDDPALIAELAAVFRQSAGLHALALSAARDAPSWTVAALKLQGLAASFGAVKLMELASQAAAGKQGDMALIREISVSIEQFDG